MAVIDLSAFQSLQCATAHDGIYLPDEECHGISLLDAECQGICHPGAARFLQTQSDKVNVVRKTRATASALWTRSVFAIQIPDAARVLQSQSVKANGNQTRLTMAQHT